MTMETWCGPLQPDARGFRWRAQGSGEPTVPQTQPRARVPIGAPAP
jgi:hypothetical protein